MTKGPSYRLTVAGGRRIATNPNLSALAPLARDLIEKGYTCWIREVGQASALRLDPGDDGPPTLLWERGDGFTTEPPEWVGRFRNLLSNL